MIEFIELSSKCAKYRTYVVIVAGLGGKTLGNVDYSEKQSKFIYWPVRADDSGNYHLAEIAELVEFLNKGERG